MLSEISGTPFCWLTWRVSSRTSSVPIVHNLWTQSGLQLERHMLPGSWQTMNCKPKVHPGRIRCSAGYFSIFDATIDNGQGKFSTLLKIHWYGNCKTLHIYLISFCQKESGKGNLIIRAYCVPPWPLIVLAYQVGKSFHGIPVSKRFSRRHKSKFPNSTQVESKTETF